jgi:hypothetical protein
MFRTVPRMNLSSIRHLVPRPLRLAASAQLAERNSARLQRELAEFVSKQAPIVAGPWLGEVGFELLYWLPFLAWFADRFEVPPDRLVVLSRGGSGIWYRRFASRYSDVFEQVSPETFRARHDARVREIGEQKQTRITAFERELLAGAAQRIGLDGSSVLHPSRMYDLLNPFWWGHLSSDWVYRHTRYHRLPESDRPGVSGLPASYVAVKFYFNECFPPSSENRLLVRDVLRSLAGRTPVVFLSTGLEIDDHGGYDVDGINVQQLPRDIEPARNLEIQSAVVAGARAFVGTYGGFSYLAPFHGVPSVAYYSNRNGFSPKHLAMAQSVFHVIGSDNLLHVNETVAGLAPLSAIEERLG